MANIPVDINVSSLAVDAFDGLTNAEKKYSCYIAEASWAGAKICLFQCSYEAPAIFTIFQLVFSGQTLEELQRLMDVGADEFTQFVTYAAGFYSNMGNYKSFGDNKFVPQCSQGTFKKAVTLCRAYTSSADFKSVLDDAWAMAGDLIFSTDTTILAFPPAGVSTYYSRTVTLEQAQSVQRFLDHHRIEAWNSRLFVEEDTGAFVVRLASVDKAIVRADAQWEGKTVRVETGDHSPIMQRVCDALLKAKEYAANDLQTDMMELYVGAFKTGSTDTHKNASRLWVQDKAPNVESYIGFIENYRDALGVRSEFEGFAAVVNKEMSKKFGALVEASSDLLQALPWPNAFEKDAFLLPDFTSLDVLAFGSSGIPAGINIPNYNGIRQDEGFKNVSLGNVIKASLSSKKTSFLLPEDEPLYQKLVQSAFEVQVGLHELFGHGSGKHFCHNEDGSLNFSQDTINPITGQPVGDQCGYKCGESWSSLFGAIASSFEECRAECVGIFLCIDQRVLSIFGFEGEIADDIVYVNWLNMVRAGLAGLEMYRPESKTWGQAHMRARFAILRVLLEGCPGLVTLREHRERGIVVLLDRKLIPEARKCIGAFLTKLQVYQSTADVSAGTKMFEEYTTVDDVFLRYRKLVIENKTERPLVVQPNMSVKVDENGGPVTISLRSQTVAGIVESFIDRYAAFDADLWALFKDEARYHKQ